MCGATPTNSKIHFESSKPCSFYSITIKILLRKSRSCQFGETIGVLKIILFTHSSGFIGFVV